MTDPYAALRQCVEALGACKAAMLECQPCAEVECKVVQCDYIKAALASADGSITVARAALDARPEPYGQVTVVRRPGCVDQHWFYPWPEPPYLDNAAECHTVYTAPPQREPLFGERLSEVIKGAGADEMSKISGVAALRLIRAVERAHGIGEDRHE